MKWTLVAIAVAVALAATVWFLRSSSTRALEPGDTAPDFELPGSDGRTWHLVELRGKQAVVLAWFPKAFTGG